MIDRMESANVRIGRVADDEIVITLKGNDTKLSIDQFKELMKISQTFWEANDLYQWTSEAIADRKRWEDESKTASGPSRLMDYQQGMVSGRVR